jgi:biofilm PGA synthesis N-glycosyltransferase PgaC
MNLFAPKQLEESQTAADGSGAQQTTPSAPVSWEEFDPAQQREADENRSSTVSQRQHRSFYLPVKGKFVLSTAFACAWVFLSWNLAQPWLSELANDIGYAPAVVIIFFIALFPGFLNAHIISSVILDRPPELRFDLEYPPINLLIAAYNEAQEIAETIRGIKGQDYPGQIDIIVVDDGSTDTTISILNSFDLPYWL